MAKILKNLFLFLSIMIAIVFFASCEKYTFTKEKPTVSDDTVFFKAEIQPIFDAKCLDCHNGGTSPDLRSDKSYGALTKGSFVNLPAEESKLFKILNTDSYHASLLTQEEKGFILSWVSQGAQDN